MSKRHQSPTRKRPPVPAAPRREVVQPDVPTGASGGFAAYLESVTQEMLAVTYWFEPAFRSEPYPVTVRFTGRRLDVQGRVQAADKFVRDETIEKVIPGCGPVSLTARIEGIHPGKWTVTAQVLGTAPAARGSKEQEVAPPMANAHSPVIRLWHRWAPSVESSGSMHTCLAPFAHVPGILPGIWGGMVFLGMIVALLFQGLVISIDRLALGPWWIASLVGIAVGAIGAKVWYIVQYRHEHRFNGWCIQGFVLSAPLAAVAILAALRIPIGLFLDVTAPGLLFAMSIGRIGCFFAGCCGGPPTASRWSVWSSDQRVGARRRPTQLLESALALSLGVGTLALVLSHGPGGGAIFVAGVAAYTLVRQGILRLRAERRRTRFGSLVTALVAASVLLAAIILLVR